MIAGMGGKRINIWDVHSLTEGDDESGEQVKLERQLTGMQKSVRCLALRESLDVAMQ